MARPRKLLSEQTGHLTVYTQERRKIEEESIKQDVKLPERPPAHLDKIAKKEWKTKVALMNANETIGELDRANFEGYCINYSGFVQTTKRLEQLRKRDGPADMDTEEERKKTCERPIKAYASTGFFESIPREIAGAHPCGGGRAKKGGLIARATVGAGKKMAG